MQGWTFLVSQDEMMKCVLNQLARGKGELQTYIDLVLELYHTRHGNLCPNHSGRLIEMIIN